jgi:YgiT-type zinc finger domain-containing protein
MTEKKGGQPDPDLEKYRALIGDEPEACEACGGSLELEKVNLEDYQGGKLYMMESVPSFVCQECGEVWVPEPLMEEFEKMIATAKAKTAEKNQTKVPLRKVRKK